MLEEVDTVVLLSEAGQMVCSGDRRSIEELVSNEGGSIEVLCTSVTSAAQGSSGGLLDEESADQEAPLLGEQGVEMRSLLTTYTDTHYPCETIQPTAAVLQENVRRKYLQSTAYQTLRDCIIFPDTNGHVNTMQNSVSLPVDSAAVSADTERNLPVEDNTRSITMQSSTPVLLLYTKRGYALAPLSQVWVLVSQAAWVSYLLSAHCILQCNCLLLTKLMIISFIPVYLHYTYLPYSLNSAEVVPFLFGLPLL